MCYTTRHNLFSQMNGSQKTGAQVRRNEQRTKFYSSFLFRTRIYTNLKEENRIVFIIIVSLHLSFYYLLVELVLQI